LIFKIKNTVYFKIYLDLIEMYTDSEVLEFDQINGISDQNLLKMLKTK